MLLHGGPNKTIKPLLVKVRYESCSYKCHHPVQPTNPNTLIEIFAAVDDDVMSGGFALSVVCTISHLHFHSLMTLIVCAKRDQLRYLHRNGKSKILN